MVAQNWPTHSLKKFSQSPTKNYPASPPIYLHSLLHIQSDTCTRASIGYHCHLSVAQFSSRLRITDISFNHHAPVPGNAFPKKIRQLFTLVNYALLLRFLIYPHLNLSPGLKLNPPIISPQSFHAFAVPLAFFTRLPDSYLILIFVASTITVTYRLYSC